MTPPQHRLGFAPGVILVLISVPVFVGALDLTVVSAVLPAVMADLRIPADTGLDDAAWMVTAYLLSYTVSMAFMGRVSDLWGRRRAFASALLIFMVGSVLAAAATTVPAALLTWVVRTITQSRPDAAFMGLYALIGGRVVQAFGAGALVPIGMALVGDIYAPERRALPLGIIGAVDTAGWVLGHLYGGIMVQHFEWPVLFWVNVPLALAALGLTRWALRGRPAPTAREGFDWPGAALIAGVLLALNLGLSGGPEPTAGSGTASWSLLIVAAGLFAAFVAAERRSPHPLLDLHAFRTRNFAAGSAANLLVGFCIMAGLVSVPIYINAVPTVLYGIDVEMAALIAGYLLGALTIPMALAAIGGGRMTAALGYRGTAIAGMAVAVAGFYLMSRWTPESSAALVQLFTGEAPRAAGVGTARLAAGLVLAGIGLGFTIAPIATAVINAAGDEDRGSAAALVIIMRLIGMSISISVLTNYGLRRSQQLRAAVASGVDLTELAAAIPRIVSETTTQVVGEMALIAGVVAGAALLVSLFLQRGDAAEI